MQVLTFSDDQVTYHEFKEQMLQLKNAMVRKKQQNQEDDILEAIDESAIPHQVSPSKTQLSKSSHKLQERYLNGSINNSKDLEHLEISNQKTRNKKPKQQQSQQNHNNQESQLTHKSNASSIPKLKINFNATTTNLMSSQRKKGYKNDKIHKSQKELSRLVQEAQQPQYKPQYSIKDHASTHEQWERKYYSRKYSSQMDSMASESALGNYKLLPKIYKSIEEEIQSDKIKIAEGSIEIEGIKPPKPTLKANKSMKQLSIKDKLHIQDQITQRQTQVETERRLQSLIERKEKQKNHRDDQKFTQDFALQKNSVVKIINSTLTRLKKMYEVENARTNVELQRENQKLQKSLQMQMKKDKILSIKNSNINISQVESSVHGSISNINTQQLLHKYKLDQSMFNTIDNVQISTGSQNQGFEVSNKYFIFNEQDSLMQGSNINNPNQNSKKYFMTRKNSQYLQKLEVQKQHNLERLQQSRRVLESKILLDEELSLRAQLQQKTKEKANNDLMMLKQLKSYEYELKVQTKDEQIQSGGGMLQLHQHSLPLENQFIANMVNHKINSKSSQHKKQVSNASKREQLPPHLANLLQQSGVSPINLKSSHVRTDSKRLSVVSSKRGSTTRNQRDEEEPEEVLLSFDIKIKNRNTNNL
ncbi:UNKNOWN [Stylonychia lemnae]|uniref:Uncharacterized protein n=1 Tax=Stylonychia lemnae TaxID=5949 RepID=A0A078AWY7_STYLE|nr:UNKNOWN [Stylonychia lemnae]|eukprot:CDW85767.1 UNKNOWN [Stylonychia lemnae]